jgi:predicted transposase YdaD
MKTDSLFYRLFQERPELVFELAELPLPEGASYTLHAEEVQQTRFHLNGLLMPPEERLELQLVFNVFIEAQFQPLLEFCHLKASGMSE